MLNTAGRVPLRLHCYQCCLLPCSTKDARWNVGLGMPGRVTVVDQTRMPYGFIYESGKVIEVPASGSVVASVSLPLNPRNPEAGHSPAVLLRNELFSSPPLYRRSFVVRRRPEDTVGRNDAAPRAPALSWFGEPPTAEGASRPFLPVTFHVYAPNAAFRKRQPGSPDFWLAVCRYSDPMPSHNALISLTEGHIEVQRAKRDEEGDQPRGRDDDIRARGEVGQDAGATPFGRVRSRGDTSCAKGPQDLSTDWGRQSSSVGAVDARGTQSETGGADGERGGQGSSRGLETGGGMRSLKIAVVSGDGNVHIFDVGLHVL